MAVPGQIGNPMTYCTECGQDHHAGEREAETALDREVEMERLRTARDVQVAKIQAGVIRDTVELEAETVTEVAELETEAELIEAGTAPPATRFAPSELRRRAGRC